MMRLPFSLFSSLVLILPTSSSKSAPSPSVFQHFQMETELSLVSCAFCRPHLPKVLRPVSSVSYDVYVKPSSCYSLVRILPTAFPDRAAHLRKHDPPSATTAATLPEKNTGFRAQECFQPEFTHSQSLTLPDYLHEDVVAMMIGVMMWLPSW